MGGQGALVYPVLVMGRKLGPEDIQRAASLGARACLAKPFSGAEALDRVGRLLRAPSPPPPQQQQGAVAYI